MKFELTTLENYSDEALLSEIKRVADLLTGQRLTREKFDSLSRVHSTTLHKRFGSWRESLDKAEISESIAPRLRVPTRNDLIQSIKEYIVENPLQSPTVQEISKRLGCHVTSVSSRFGSWKAILAEVGLAPVPLGRRYTEADCFENILNLWTHYSRQPNFAELNKPPSKVGAKAYIRRWGGWRAALSAFVKEVNDSNASKNTTPEIVPKSQTQDENSQIPVHASRTISLALRYRVFARDKFRCVICGASPAKDGSVELHVDHIFPWSRGGQNIETNLRTLCFKCNLGKGDKLEDLTDKIRI